MKKSYIRASDLDTYLGEIKGVAIRADFHTSGHVVHKSRVRSNPDNRIMRGAEKTGKGSLHVTSDTLNWNTSAERMLHIKDGNDATSAANGWIPAEYVMIPKSIPD